MEIVPAPDFPTAGIIYGLNGVREGYRTGRGKVVMRAKCHFEDIDKGQRQAIIVDEIPYQVNKKTLLERIAELVHEKKLDGISHIQDESDKSGMRVVIELKRGEVPEVVLNNLYKQTQLQDTFGINMVALIDGQPRLCNLKQLIEIFLEHRREVVTRRTVYELRKARERGHVLEGLAVALANIDEFIETIKTSPTPPVAKAALMAKSWDSSMVREMLARAEKRPPAAARGLPPRRPAAQLRPAGRRPVPAERRPGAGNPADAPAAPDRAGAGQDHRRVPRGDGADRRPAGHPGQARARQRHHQRRTGGLKPEFGQTKLGARRSHIERNALELGTEDLITPTDMVVTLSHTGYIKSQPLSEYRAQKRGGRGKQATADQGRRLDRPALHRQHARLDPVLQRPRPGLLAQGLGSAAGLAQQPRQAHRQHVPAAAGEKITVVLPLTGEFRSFPADHYVFMSTALGTVKKTSLDEFSNPRKAGIIAVDLDEGDFLIGAALTDGKHDVMLFSDGGKAVRFDEDEVRPLGRTARGVRGMALEDGQSVIAMLVAEDETQSVLTATENGYGKRTSIVEYTRHGRGTKGMIAIQQSERNGKVVAATLVRPGRRDHADHRQGRAGAHPHQRDPRTGPRHPGRDADRPGRRLQALGLQRIVENDAPYNFSAGPAALPEPVLAQAAAEMLDWHGSGMGVMEMSHRGREFISIYEQAEADLRELLAVPAHFRILFMQGGGWAKTPSCR
jgi:DNA gyrase subunit A